MTGGHRMMAEMQQQAVKQEKEKTEHNVQNDLRKSNVASIVIARHPMEVYLVNYIRRKANV